MSTDEHIMETTGRARVVIRNGEVVSVGKPILSSCPLALKFSSPVHSMTGDEIRSCVAERISTYGMFTKNRKVISGDDFVLFGASEVLGCALDSGAIDCAVIACDGAGTVIAWNSRLVQGIGGLMSGLVKTCPYPEVIERIEKNGGIVVFPEDASLDQYGGVKAAAERGMKRIAVTTASPREAESIRRDFPGSIIFAVHTTGISCRDAEIFSDNCDIVYACASGAVMEEAGKKAIAQFGKSVPVFAFSKDGRNLFLEKIKGTEEKIVISRSALPVKGDRSPDPLV